MTRKEFIEQMGGGTAALILTACAVSCKKKSTTAQGPSGVDFTVSVASGALASNGGYIVQSGVIVARTTSGSYIAVASTCTHAGCTVGFTSSNIFSCPCHGATFDTSGNVTNGPATAPLKKYNTTLTGTSLRVYS